MKKEITLCLDDEEFFAIVQLIKRDKNHAYRGGYENAAQFYDALLKKLEQANKVQF